MSEKNGNDAAMRIQDDLVFGEYGDVNPSICDSTTFTFLDPKTMEEVFEGKTEGCFLYARHWNPTTEALSHALADLEGTESATVTASGMAAISATILQICAAGDHVVASRTIYGGTYAFLANFCRKLGIETTFVDAINLDEVRAAMKPATKVVYVESISNPLLEVADLKGLADIAHAAGAKLVVDNTFSPLMITPSDHGADIVIHSLTKYVNGTSDCVAGCICGSAEFVRSLIDVNDGATMLLGPVLDSLRAASILKNLHGLHLRMQKHSANAARLASYLHEKGFPVHYPGLPHHPQHERLKTMLNDNIGFGGMVVLDVGTRQRANQLMKRMQEEKVGYLAVSLGYFKTLFSAPGHSTSSEIPEEMRASMGLGDGLVRFSVGLDHDMTKSIDRIVKCLRELGED